VLQRGCAAAAAAAVAAVDAAVVADDDAGDVESAAVLAGDADAELVDAECGVGAGGVGLAAGVNAAAGYGGVGCGAVRPAEDDDGLVVAAAVAAAAIVVEAVACYSIAIECQPALAYHCYATTTTLERHPPTGENWIVSVGAGHVSDAATAAL